MAKPSGGWNWLANRVVAQLVDQLEVDFHWLVESHVTLVLKMSSSWRSLYTGTR